MNQSDSINMPGSSSKANKESKNESKITLIDTNYSSFSISNSFIWLLNNLFNQLKARQKIYC